MKKSGSKEMLSPKGSARKTTYNIKSPGDKKLLQKQLQERIQRELIEKREMNKESRTPNKTKKNRVNITRNAIYSRVGLQDLPADIFRYGILTNLL